MFNTSREKAAATLETAPTFKELLEESRRQCDLAHGDFSLAIPLHLKALVTVDKACNRLRQWKDAHPDFDASDPRLVALLQDYSDADDAARMADQLIREACQRKCRAERLR
ncbi:hypothetical protein LEN26_007846 [Aphanomyces euteiches]|nr:hypothetical protein AeMF1_008836 [Aphanomyces euteiches]KAH9131202.1 hypothetical protein LEN26_007846 [Aphanomyces euteiches]KAH9196226.1 hypothetical protein AeNC1_001790 [Aphanomyces euteiches]